MSTVNLDPAKDADVEKVETDQPKEEPKRCLFFRIVEAIWPVRHYSRETAKSGELFIRTALRNLVIYTVFMAMLLIIVYSGVSSINYFYTTGILSLFVDQTSSGTQATFRNGYSSYQDVWNFLQGPLLSGLYSGETWYDLTQTQPPNLDYIYYQNKIIGVPRLRQVRVKDNACSIPKAMNTYMTNCISVFSGQAQSSDPFGVGLSGNLSNAVTPSAWVFTKDSSGSSYTGLISTYPPDGYMVNLGQYNNVSTITLQDLFDNRWLDQFTSALFIDFTIYNGNLNLFHQERLVIEFVPTGGFLTSWQVSTSNYLRFSTAGGRFVLVCEFILLVFLIYYTIEEIIDICINRLKYFKDFTNAIDLVVIGLCYMMLVVDFLRSRKVDSTLDALLVDNDQYHSFDEVLFYQTLFFQLGAFAVFFAWFKVFKYVSINKIFSRLNATLSKSSTGVMYLGVTIFIIFFSYASVIYLLFHSNVSFEYKNIGSSLFTLFRILVGDFDILTLKARSPILGPIYFFSFNFIGFFILLNIFMAIMNESYEQVRAESEKQTDLMLSDYIRLKYAGVVEKLSTDQWILDLYYVLKVANDSQLDLIEFKFFKNVLKEKGYSPVEIDVMFAKFDKDGDRKLNEVEKLRMEKCLVKAKNKLKEEMNRSRRAQKKQEKTEANLQEEEDENKKMTREDFEFAIMRIEDMELSVAGIVNKLDRVFAYLENMESAKMKRRIELTKNLQAQMMPEKRPFQ